MPDFKWSQTLNCLWKFRSFLEFQGEVLLLNQTNVYSEYSLWKPSNIWCISAKFIEVWLHIKLHFHLLPNSWKLLYVDPKKKHNCKIITVLRFHTVDIWPIDAFSWHLQFLVTGLIIIIPMFHYQAFSKFTHYVLTLLKLKMTFMVQSLREFLLLFQSTWEFLLTVMK